MNHSYSTYKRGCRCDECVRASRRYDKRRRISKARGIDLLVPSTTAREHVEFLTSRGMSRRSIAAAAGYQKGTGLNVILSRRKIRRTTEAKILSVSPSDDRLGVGWVDAVGTCRRMQALAAMGWPMRVVVERAGINADTASDVRLGKTARVSERVYESVRVVFEELCMRDGGDVRSRRDAGRRGWLPPLAWDNIDDPGERPKGRR